MNHDATVYTATGSEQTCVINVDKIYGLDYSKVQTIEDVKRILQMLNISMYVVPGSKEGAALLAKYGDLLIEKDEAAS